MNWKNIIGVAILLVVVIGVLIGASKYTAEEEEQTPVMLNYEVPVTTAADSKAAAEMTMGITCGVPEGQDYIMYERDGVMYNLTDKDFEWESLGDYPVPEEEFNGKVYYGYKGTSLIDNKSEIVTFTMDEECRITLEYDEQGRPKMGTFLFDLSYDPNNGWVRVFICNYNILGDECLKCDDTTPEDDCYDGYVNVHFKGMDKNPDYEEYLSLI